MVFRESPLCASVPLIWSSGDVKLSANHLNIHAFIRFPFRFCASLLFGSSPLGAFTDYLKARSSLLDKSDASWVSALMTPRSEMRR